MWAYSFVQSTHHRVILISKNERVFYTPVYFQHIAAIITCVKLANLNIIGSNRK